MRNIQEECKSQLHRGGSLKSDIRLVYKDLKEIRWELCGLLYYIEYRLELCASRYFREYRLQHCRLLYYKTGRFECGPPYYKEQ